MNPPADRALPPPVDGIHDDHLHLGAVRIADPPIPYRAYEIGRWRYGWSGQRITFRLSTAMVPSHFALTFELMPNGEWRLRETKPFETDAEARRWAEWLWREAASGRASAR